jgi:single-strand DNA-binding protein
MNSVSLIGRLGRDPDVRLTPTGTKIARFSIAIDRPPAKDGSKVADWPQIVCFGKTAEIVELYVKKGYLVGIEGRIQTGSYEKEGRKIYTTDVIANRVQFLDRGRTQSGGDQDGGFKPSNYTAQTHEATPASEPPASDFLSDDNIEGSGELPF